MPATPLVSSLLALPPVASLLALLPVAARLAAARRVVARPLVA
ncbi:MULTISPECIES: hypothetical protein [Micromonospora]|nr:MULTISPECIES: hypothetical protein [Micromonospora]AEB46235.1 hypothetical protein VAB18032_25685 [Micromonospora maris AB-18-032]